MANQQSPDLGTQIFVSLATAPFLVGLVGLDCLTKIGLKLSQESREIFRGDRLPLVDSNEYSSDHS